MWFLSDKIIFPAVIAAAGGALIWRQAQTAPEARAHRARVPREAVNRAGVGAALVVGGALLFLSLNDSLTAARDVILPVTVVLIAVAIILAPWWIRMVRGLTAERAARIRSQERAEVAAHLHDSVLQTLALVQKRADDPREVAALARRQERELRAWLNNIAAEGQATRWPARWRRPPPRSRTTITSRSRSSPSATGRSTTAPPRSSPPPARRS